MPKGGLTVACAVTHTDEITLELCLEAIHSQTWPIAAQTVVSGTTPASAAFNACLDFARSHGVDLLFHVAADSIIERFALRHLLRRLHIRRHYAASALGFDMFNGDGVPVDVSLLNMRLIDDGLRFRDEYMRETGFYERVERATGAGRVYSAPGLRLAYHHPIWTPPDIYRSFRHNSARYPSKTLLRHVTFFREQLARNPDNIVLRIGYETLLSFAEHPAGPGALDHARYHEHAEALRLTYNLDGTEYYALHSTYKAVAQRLLASTHDCVTITDEADTRAHESSATAHSAAPVRLCERLRENVARPVFHKLPRQLRNIYHAQVRGRRRLRSLRSRASAALYDRMRLLREHAPESLKRVYRGARDRWNVRRKDWHEYGSITRGNEAFREKWERSPGRRVLMCAPKDYAGSMMKWATALHRHSRYAVRLLTFTTHQFGYDTDLVVPETDRGRRAAVVELASSADVLHLKDEQLLFLDEGRGPTNSILRGAFAPERRKGRATVFTLYGGYARKFRQSESYQAFVLQFDRRIVMTPDLNFEWVDGVFIPHAIDAATSRYEWKDTNRFAHSPSSKFKKGACLMLEAQRFFEGRGNWTVDLIEGVDHQECLLRKKKASLFFDQAGRHRVADLGIDDVIGWYGNSALEAMVFGIPTIAHLSDEAFEGARRAGKDIRDRCPVINTPPLDPGGMRRTLEMFLALDGTERERLAKRTRSWIEEFHDYPVVAHALEDVYDDVLGVTSSTRAVRSEPS